MQSGRWWCCLQPLFGHSGVPRLQRREAGGGGVLKCDTKITTYRVVNMSQLCTCLLKGFGFDSNKT